MEWLEYDLLFCWFVGIGIDDAAADHSVEPRRAAGSNIAAKLAETKKASQRRCGV
jgi:hypothetical protein